MKLKILTISHILLSLLLMNNCKGSKLENRDLISDSFNIALVNADTLRLWKQRIIGQGDSNAFSDLMMYYDDEINQKRKQELIPYIEIMAEKYDNADAYLLYYNYIVELDSLYNSPKAIEYLKIATEKNASLISDLARSELANLYREGRFIKKDTIIANYLEQGGHNIDSIFQVRNR